MTTAPVKVFVGEKQGKPKAGKLPMPKRATKTPAPKPSAAAKTAPAARKDPAKKK